MYHFLLTRNLVGIWGRSRELWIAGVCYFPRREMKREGLTSDCSLWRSLFYTSSSCGEKISALTLTQSSLEKAGALTANCSFYKHVSSTSTMTYTKGYFHALLHFSHSTSHSGKSFVSLETFLSWKRKKNVQASS